MADAATEVDEEEEEGEEAELEATRVCERRNYGRYTERMRLQPSKLKQKPTSSKPRFRIPLRQIKRIKSKTSLSHGKTC